ncbi:MAG TPA: hypothetical protein VFE50_20170 [Cyclobacteriaceae bacterium]|nr:hypothetical protein [Cyclobacteriaceae bacterium]
MQLGTKKMRKFSSGLLGLVILVFIFSSVVPAHSAAPESENRDAVQTSIATPIPFNTPSEQPFSSVVGKVLFVNTTFLVEKLLDLPAQEIDNNPAILKNSYQHNVFYVQVTAKAP